MSPVQEVALVVARELKKNLRSVKGLILLGLSALLAVGTTLIVVAGEKLRAENIGDGRLSAAQARDMSLQSLTAFYDGDVARHIVDAPATPIALTIGTVWLVPGLAALMCFDSVAGETQHRTVRYWSIRMRRPSYYVGKVLGAWGVVCAVTFVTHVLAWILSIARGADALPTIEWGLRLWPATTPIALAWCAVAVFASSLVRTPMYALLCALGFNFALWLTWMIARVKKIDPLTYVYPNRIDVMLLSPDFARTLGGVAICLAFVAVFAVAGGAIFQKRDL